MWHVDAEMVCKTSADVALRQINEAVRRVNSDGVNILCSRDVRERGRMLKEAHAEWVRALDRAEDTFPSPSRAQTPSGSLYRETPPPPVGSCYTVPNIIGVLRRAIQTLTPSQGMETLILNESISYYMETWAHMRSEVAGSMIMSGGASQGWALGACVGAVIGGNVVGAEVDGTIADGETVVEVGEAEAAEVAEDKAEPEKGGNGYELVVAIVGDGSFMFGVPSSAFWMARKYETVRRNLVFYSPSHYKNPTGSHS
jgi:thiamine pyrophosphate-dependent acetolactate synthase large subunit-like protein